MMLQNSGVLSRIIDVASGRADPDLLLTGGRVLNVYTGRLEEADVAIAAGRIAYVGSLKEAKIGPGDRTRIVDVTDRVLVPGYIEPHAHPFQLYHPVTLTEKVLPLGTTALICDNLFLFSRMATEEFLSLADDLARLPVHLFWWARFDSQATLPDEDELFSHERVRDLLSHPRVLQGGELTAWPSLLAGDERMVRWIEDLRGLGKRVEGHAPGSSYKTLARLAAAGVTGDHEPITPEEVWDRLRLGYMTTLRHSSLRPDLPILLEGLLKKDNVPWHRLMMTTDGPTPAYLRHGFVDYLIKTALEAGCDPVEAYRMVTINPAVYYRLDEHLGGIAPGRVADINVLSGLDQPTPVQVIAGGRIVAEEGKLLIPLPRMDWSRYGELVTSFSWRADADHFALSLPSGGSYPVIQLLNPVITRVTEESLPVRGGRVQLPPEDDRLLAHLVDRDGAWITRGVLRGFGRGIDGLASTYNGSGDLLVLGQRPDAMARAANRALEQGGGIVWIQGDEERFNLPLPIGGGMSERPVDELIFLTEQLTRELKAFGHPFYDPIYTFLFLSSTHLPQVRLTARGLLRIKDGRVLVPAERLK